MMTALLYIGAGVGALVLVAAVYLLLNAVLSGPAVPPSPFPHRIPLTGPSGAVAAMGDDEAWAFFQAMAPPGFVNEVCARILIRMDKYHPIRHLGSIRCPVLLQTCDADPSCPPRTVDDAAARLGDRGRVIRHPIGHFDIYRGEHRERALREQIEFFGQHLAPAEV